MQEVIMGEYKRIDLREARKLFDSGERVYVVPCNCHVKSQFCVPVNNTICLNFDSWLCQFEFYNCNKELGKKPYYYKFIKNND